MSIILFCHVVVCHVTLNIFVYMYLYASALFISSQIFVPRGKPRLCSSMQPEFKMPRGFPSTATTQNQPAHARCLLVASVVWDGRRSSSEFLVWFVSSDSLNARAIKNKDQITTFDLVVKYWTRGNSLCKNHSVAISQLWSSLSFSSAVHFVELLILISLGFLKILLFFFNKSTFTIQNLFQEHTT